LRDIIFDKKGLTAADIPGSILDKEHELRINISSFEKKIAEVPDSADEMECRSKLFDLNRQYDDLIALIEKNYPEYYNLKYDNKNVSVEDLQKILDNKTAIRSYFMGDSTVFIFTLTQNDLYVRSVPRIKNLEDTIRCFREMLELPDENGSEKFKSLAGLLYKQLFPDDITADTRIENLVVIPDGVLSTIPFEVLSHDDKSPSYRNMSFLIKRFTISGGQKNFPAT